MYGLPQITPDHWPRLILAGYTRTRDEKLEAQRARAAHARYCRMAPISQFFAPETEASFFVRGRSSTAYQSTSVDFTIKTGG